MSNSEESFLVVYEVFPGPPPSPRGVDRRNVGLIGAPDAGSTTLTERMVSMRPDDQPIDPVDIAAMIDDLVARDDPEYDDEIVALCAVLDSIRRG